MYLLGKTECCVVLHNIFSSFHVAIFCVCSFDLSCGGQIVSERHSSGVSSGLQSAVPYTS